MVTAPRNLVLLGFMGAGKTTVGECLARRLGRPFLDIDHWIEAKIGKPIPQIFQERGEAAFRVLESEAVAYLGAPTGKVLACGGGIVKNSENVQRLAEGGILVCLSATPETVLARVGHQRHRPLLAGDDPGGTIRRLMEERAALYRAIPLQVATDGKSPEQVAADVLAVSGLTPPG